MHQNSSIKFKNEGIYSIHRHFVYTTSTHQQHSSLYHQLTIDNRLLIKLVTKVWSRILDISLSRQNRFWNHKRQNILRSVLQIIPAGVKDWNATPPSGISKLLFYHYFPNQLKQASRIHDNRKSGNAILLGKIKRLPPFYK